MALNATYIGIMRRNRIIFCMCSRNSVVTIIIIIIIITNIVVYVVVVVMC